MKRWGVIAVLALLCWWGLTIAVPASSDLQLESRIDRLESELSRVRSQLTQLAARSGAPTPPPATSTPNGLNDPSLSEQFDNLATLAIELKQDVRDLQTRVAELEAARGDR